MKKKWADRIDIALQNADFDKWAETMSKLEWKWNTRGGAYVPCANELERNARLLLTRVVEEDLALISTGGITAIKTKGRLILAWGYCADSEEW